MIKTDGHWEIQLQGDSRDLEYLASRFVAPPVVVMYDQASQQYCLICDSFEELDAADSALGAAQSVVAKLSGVIAITNDSEVLLKASGILFRRTNGSREVFVVITEGIKLKTQASVIKGVGVTSGGDSVEQQPDPSLTLFELGRKDVAVAEVLERLGKSDAYTWVGLYRLHEIVRENVGGFYALTRLGWRSETDVRRFQHSANSVAVAGFAARHGVEQGDPPKNPMRLEEAISYCKALLNAWFESKRH